MQIAFPVLQYLNTNDLFALLVCLNTLHGCFTVRFIVSYTKLNITGNSYTAKLTNL